jgi:RsiW-degrading membrane proteinase PrsW (M82 family)
MYMSPWTILVHLAWLPVVFILFLKLYKGPHPVAAALLAYFLGGLMVTPALALQQLWNAMVPRGSISEMLELPLWFIPVEEGSKLVAALLSAVVLRYEPPRRSFLPIAVAAALGFAVAETGFAVAVFGADSLPLRVLVSVPSHAVFTLFAAAGLVGKPAHPFRLRAFLGWWTLATGAHFAFNIVSLHETEADALDVFVWQAELGAAAALLATARWIQRKVATTIRTRAVRRA